MSLSAAERFAILFISLKKIRMKVTLPIFRYNDMKSLIFFRCRRSEELLTISQSEVRYFLLFDIIPNDLLNLLICLFAVSRN